MQFLKKRGVAVIIAIVVILGAGLLSAQNGLNKAVRKVENLYYEGVPAERGNYLRPSIDSQMRVKFNSVNSLLGIANAHPELESASEALRLANDMVYAHFGDYDRDTVAGMSDANAELEKALTQFRLALDNLLLESEVGEASSESSVLGVREADMLETCLEDIAGAQRMIEDAGYNEAVRKFNTTKMQRFPARQLLPLFGNKQGGASYF